MFRERAHDIALGQDADHTLLGAEHDERADTVLGEDGDRFFERGIGADRDDVAALGGQNRF